MEKRGNKVGGSVSRTEKTLKSLSTMGRIPLFWFFILLAVYAAATVTLWFTSASDGVMMIAHQPVPYRSMTGVFSSIANLCIIFLVFFFGKQGFFVALAILLVQFPRMFIDLVFRHNYTTISGLFSNLMIIFAICLIYRTNRKVEKYQVRLRDQAITDRLTGLPNRFACAELTDQLVRRGETFVIAVLNLNNFKSINSTMGQNTGNEVLIETGARWKEIADQGLTGTTDFVTSQGGDEFSLIIRGYNSEEDIIRTLRYYQKILENRMTIDGCDFFLTARVGYAEYPADAKNSDTLLACALTALNQAKHLSDNNQICRYTTDLMDVEHEVEIERKIRTALETDRLFYCLQPQFDMSHRIRGFEVLARLKDADGKIVSPAEFIPVAEKLGLIDRVDYTVFKNAAVFFAELLEKTGADITLSINVSVRHLMRNDFMDEVRGVLSASGLPPRNLEIEITESIMIDSIEKALECIGEIRSMGIRVAIDDFGTGYSSLSYLNNFPADMLKVDKSFVDKMNTGEASRRYVAAIISIGHMMNFDVIAEGVEEMEQLETLGDIGCDFIQGFIWGRPMLPEEAQKLVEEGA